MRRRTTSLRVIAQIARTPSHLVSNSQSGELNGVSTSVGNIGERQMLGELRRASSDCGVRRGVSGPLTPDISLMPPHASWPQVQWPAAPASRSHASQQYELGDVSAMTHLQRSRAHDFSTQGMSPQET